MTSDKDKDNIIIRDGGSNSAVWFLAGIVVIALIAGAFFYFNGYFGGGESAPQDVNVELEMPSAPAPDGEPAAPAE